MTLDNDVSRSVRRAVDAYLKDLDGEKPCAVYDMVMHCVERPMLEAVLQRVKGNQTHAAQVLGINRSTLRKKLQQYGIKG